MSHIQEILQKKERRREKLESSLASIANQLRRVGARKIILFGSLAKNDVDVASDLDLLVIMPSTRSGKEWMRLIYDDVERGVASDLLVYNEDEFQEDLPVSSLLQNIANSGKVVYEETA